MESVFILLAEIILGIAIGDIAQRSSIASYREKLRGPSREEEALARALKNAYVTFEKKYPDLSESLFDEPFLTSTGVATELAKSLTPDQSPSISTLAILWQQQFPKKPNIDLNTPIKDYIFEFETNIKSEPDLRPFFDSRSLEKLHGIASSLERQNTQYDEMIQQLKLIHGELSNNKKTEEPESKHPSDETLFQTPNASETFRVNTEAISDDDNRPSEPHYGVDAHAIALDSKHDQESNENTVGTVIYCVGKRSATIIKVLISKLEYLARESRSNLVISARNLDQLNKVIEDFQQDNREFQSEILLLNNREYAEFQMNTQIKEETTSINIVKACTKHRRVDINH